MSLNIYFHIDELARDAIVASALKKEISSRGHKLTYGNRMLTSRLVWKLIHSFDVIIVPRPIFMAGIERLGENVKIPPVVILFTESVGSVVDLKYDKLTVCTILGEDFMEGNCPYFEKIAAFLLWGNTTLDRIKKYHPNVVDKCTVVGHPRHDEKCIDLAITEDKNGKIKIGLITRYYLLNDFENRKPIEAVVRSSLNIKRYNYYNKKTGDFLLDPENNNIDGIYIEASDIDVTLKIINSLDRDKYDVFLRVHPRENMGTWVHFAERYNINVKFTDWRTPFAHWAKSMDYVIGPASTCFYDCCMLGVKPISIQNINPIYYEHLKGTFSEEFNALTGHIDKPNSVENLLELIKSRSDSSEPSEEIREILSLETDYPGCKSSISKIVDKCLALAETANKNQLVKYINLVLFYFFARLLTSRVRIMRCLRRQPAQSSTFLLTRKTKKFIDSLVGG